MRVLGGCFFARRVTASRSTVVAWSIITVSLIVGVLTRFVPLLHYVDFIDDQAYNAFVNAHMHGASALLLGERDPSYHDFMTKRWYGHFPTVGPPVSKMRFFIAPLYYYIVFPLTMLSSNPTLQAIPNAVFSFLTIPLVMFSVYRLLEGCHEEKRFMSAAVSGLWWSLMLNEIVRGTRDWNPSSVPFFLLLFMLTFISQLEGVSINGRRRLRPAFSAGSSSPKSLKCAAFPQPWAPRSDEKFEPDPPTSIYRDALEKPAVLCLQSVISWITIGFIWDVLMSLHGSMIYLIPVLFTIFSMTFVLRSQRKTVAAIMPFIALTTAAVCLTPYWYGETHGSWKNSQAIIRLAENRSFVQLTPAQKVSNAVRSYLWLDGGFYFISNNIKARVIGLIFLVLIIIIPFMTFQGNRVFLTSFVCLWIVFLCETATFPATEERYRLPLIMAPLFLAIASLAFLPRDPFVRLMAESFLIAGIVISALSNVLMDIKHETIVFGPTRIAAVSDTIDMLMHVPYGATVCDDQKDINDYRTERYLDAYVTLHNLHFSQNCSPGNYSIVPKFVAWRGSELVGKDRDTLFPYLDVWGPVQGPSIAAKDRIVAQNDAIRLVLLQ